ncbi:MAG: methyltransferase family protein [Thermoanaerobaculia bacterium]
MHEVIAGVPRRSVLPPNGLLVSLLIQLPLVALAWPLSPLSWQIVSGAGLILAGLVLSVWPERLFRRNRVGVCPFTPVPRLITEGPYRISRNPMYLGFVALSAGPALLMGVAANLVASLGLLVWLHFRFVLPEEEFLRSQVGEAFETYVRNHPRWLGLPR